MLEELIEYIKSFSDVWFASHVEVAAEWRALQEGEGMWDEAAAGALGATS
jgi:hypothetical protein